MAVTLNSYDTQQTDMYTG